MKYFLSRIRRKHNALWVQLVYMEPFADPTWCVWVYRDGGNVVDKELSRSSSKWAALYRAFKVPA